MMPGEQAQEAGAGEFLNYALGFLRRRYLTIILFGVLSLVATTIYLRIVPPTYTATARVLLGNPKGQFVQQQSMLAETPIDAAQIESRLLMLRSKSIAASVIDRLKLADDPDFKVSGESVSSVWSAIRKAIGRSPQTDPVDEGDMLAAVFDSRLAAARIGYSTVIEVSFSASKAERAAEIANAVVNAYIADQLSAQAEANRTTTAWAHDRLRELGHDALVAEREVNALKAKNNIVAAGGKLMDEAQVSELNNRLVAARAQTSDASARLNQLETILTQNSSESVPIGSLDATGSDTLNNPIINNLRQQYHEYARHEFELSTRYGKDHLAVVNLRTTMKAIRASILDEVRRLAESSKNDYEVAKRRQQEIEKQLAQAVSQSRTTSSAELSVRELESSAKGYRTLYESFLQRYMGSLQQESFPISEVRLLSPATAPESKSKPKKGLVLAFGLLGGIALGAALGYLRDLMDRGFRTAAQVEAALHLPCLSLVPLLRDRTEKRLSPRKAAQISSQVRERRLSRDPKMYWAATAMPSSRFAESIRAIKLAIDLDPTKTSNRVVGITSALPNEGKSTIAASLAQLVARTGKRVILVDCDLRNPSLSKDLVPHARAGIAEVLSGVRSLEETTWTDSEIDLTFLPAQSETPILHTSEILSADRTRQLFDRLRAAYDCVIVDLPPLAPIVDVRAATPLIDCFILVVEWGRTTSDVVQHALRAAPNVYEALAGTVLNKTDMKTMKRYDNYGGDYYNNEHYIRYGQLTAE